MSVAGTRKHSKTEIAALVTQADDLAAKGMLQRDIVDALGISTMTLHRWRKAAHAEIGGIVPAQIEETSQVREPSGAAAELKSENIKLRRLVVDLLLEKVALEEAAARSLRSNGVAGKAGSAGR